MSYVSPYTSLLMNAFFFFWVNLVTETDIVGDSHFLFWPQYGLSIIAHNKKDSLTLERNMKKKSCQIFAGLKLKTKSLVKLIPDLAQKRRKKKVLKGETPNC